MPVSLFSLVLYRHKVIGSAMLLLFLLPATPGSSQQPDTIEFTQQHFTDENGLPQNSIKSMVTDRDGFIWFTTENGLVRYDGHRFYTYDNTSIPVQSNRMGSFYPVNSTDTCCNSFFALSVRYDYLAIKNGTAILKDKGFADFLARLPFHREFEDQKATILQSLQGSIRPGSQPKKCIIPDKSGASFVCTRQQVAYYKGLKKEYALDISCPDFYSLFRIGDILFQKNDRGQFTKIQGGVAGSVVLEGDILQDRFYRPGASSIDVFWNNADGSRAFIYLQNKLYLVRCNAAGNLETKLILTGFDCRTNNIISVCYNEESRTVFAGSLNRGLYTFTPKQFRTLSIAGDDRDNVYYAIAPWGTDRVLTAQGNLLGLSQSVILPAIKKAGDMDRYSMLIDRRGYIWSKAGDWVNKFDQEGKKIVARWNFGGRVSQLYEGRDGMIWIATLSLGLYRLDPLVNNAIPDPVTTNPLVQDISCLQEESDSILWVGTGRGLYRVHLQNRMVDTIDGLKHFYIRSIYIPAEGETWITTYDAGFFLFSNQRLTSFPKDRDGYLNTAHCIAADSFGYYWITTNKGLFQASRKELLDFAGGKQQSVFYLYHNREEGFYTNEFNGGCQPCAVKLADGAIALPSLNGVVTFYPAGIKTILPDKKIFVDKIEVDQVAIPLADTIRLARGFRLLQIHCSTPYSGNEYNVNLQYALIKGKERPTWLPLDNFNKVITQSSVDPGLYRIIIRKPGGFGGNNYSYRQLILIIPPAFYETNWFYAAVFILFIVAVWVYSRMRFNYIRKKNRQLESLVNERTEKLASALTNLSASERNIRRQLQVREILFAAISHDIGSPLKYMTMMAEELKQELDSENVPGKIKKHAGDIFQSGHYLYHLTRNLLQYLRISEANAELQIERFDVYQLIEKKISIFIPIADERSTTIINNLPPGYYLNNDPRLLEVIVHNLLDNAIKATRNGQIIFAITVIEGQTHLLIRDTGPGMRAAVADYYNNDAPGKEKTDLHVGFGLYIVKELARLTGIKLKIETSQSGTVVHLILRDKPATGSE